MNMENLEVESEVEIKEKHFTPLEDHVITNKHIIFSKEHEMPLRDYEDEYKSYIFSADQVDGNKPVSPPRDCISGSELNVLSHCGKELDKSSTDRLEGKDNSDVLPFIDLENGKSNGSSKDCRSIENHVLFEDRKVVEEPNVLQNFNVKKKSEKQLKGDGKDKRKAFTPSKTHKVSKKKRNRNRPMESALLYQAYLDMISSVNKKMRADFVTEKKIQPPISEKSCTYSEPGETAMNNPITPTLKSQKKSYEGNNFSKVLLRKQFRQKKAALRRDLLADSSEAYLSFLDSAGGSEEFQEYDDGPGILDRIEPSSSNEISELNSLPSSSNDSSRVGLKRYAEHVLSSDNILIQQRSNMYPQLLSKIQCRLGFQVVIMKDSHGSPLRNADLAEIQYLLDAEMIRFNLKNERSHFIPKFFGLSVDQNYNWIILNCKDQDTVNWVLNWNPPNLSFTIVEYEKAPWRSTKICFTIRKDKPEVEEVVKLLACQNRTLNVADWRPIRVTRHQGEWNLYFLLTPEESKQLDDVGWVICFERCKVQVLKL